MPGGLRGWITGVAEVPRAELPQLGEPIAANAVAIARAAGDAGVPLTSIDIVLTYDALLQPHVMQASKVAEYLGIQPAYASTIGAGGASPLFAVVLAASLLQCGVARTVAIAHSDFRASSASRSEVQEKMASVVGNPEFEDPLGPIVPTLYGLLADWLIADGDVAREDLASIAAQTRAWAGLNPNAHARQPITEAEVLASPTIAGPLGRLDCCLVTDFSGALILSAEPPDRTRAVSLAGVAGAVSHEEMTQLPEHPLSPIRRTAAALYQDAGRGPADIDAAFLYDSFTITVAAQLLAYGLLWDNGIGPGGVLPVNTHGGLLSATTSGVFHVIEAVRQLRGEAGERQVPGLGTALVTGVGGVLSHHCAAILEGPDDGR
jgi:acetyl-CoA acetyltransferase